MKKVSKVVMVIKKFLDFLLGTGFNTPLELTLHEYQTLTYFS
jgi:hypothetical protein